MNIFWSGPVIFHSPWALFAPILYFSALLFLRKKQQALLYPSGEVLEQLPKSLRQKLRWPIINFLFLLFIAFLTLAMMRPQEVRIIPEQRKARSLMLSLDVSRSMRANDFRIGYNATSRLDGVKRVVTRFLKGRSDDRIGLVVFGSGAFLQSPLTFDHALLSQIMDQLQVGIAGDGTAIGDGLGIALKRLEPIPAERKAVVLMTDGVSNSGKVAPLQAAKVAKQLGIVVHTIGIGPEQNEPINLPFGIRGDLLSRDRHFDEETLKEIAKLTGGVYFHASNLDRLQEIYRQIDTLEQIKLNEPRRKEVDELFARPLLAALFTYLLYAILSVTYFRRLP